MDDFKAANVKFSLDMALAFSNANALMLSFISQFDFLLQFVSLIYPFLFINFNFNLLYLSRLVRKGKEEGIVNCLVY